MFSIHKRSKISLQAEMIFVSPDNTVLLGIEISLLHLDSFTRSTQPFSLLNTIEEAQQGYGPSIVPSIQVWLLGLSLNNCKYLAQADKLLRDFQPGEKDWSK